MAVSHESIVNRGTWNAGVAHLRKNDRALARLMARTTISKVELAEDYYESIAQAIIYQQISGRAGDAILKKFRSLYNGRFPRPRRFLATPEKTVRAAGISPQKYSYLVDLCKRIENGSLELKKFENMHNEDIIAELDAVRGIGRWTAEMFLMFSLGRADVFPVDDLGLKKAIQKAYRLKSLPDRKKLVQISERWKPYGTIASLYLWRSQDGKEWGKV